ncbi:unnamed protein product [Darwinula stevensoni]|uniref:C2H2-type domain-containing protein n=1 Tax=Darwinula stevensoni TaxID=69355 RepID=A0A7R8ZZQ8_9CRUS|nr:unnamed protein product [Darwinula stevensoni]CAG0883011.1 unnamed protein product [Darwinula stevensoni]
MFSTSDSKYGGNDMDMEMVGTWELFVEMFEVEESVSIETDYLVYFDSLLGSRSPSAPVTLFLLRIMQGTIASDSSVATEVQSVMQEPSPRVSAMLRKQFDLGVPPAFEQFLESTSSSRDLDMTKGKLLTMFSESQDSFTSQEQDLITFHKALKALRAQMRDHTLDSTLSQSSETPWHSLQEISLPSSRGSLALQFSHIAKRPSLYPESIPQLYPVPSTIHPEVSPSLQAAQVPYEMVTSPASRLPLNPYNLRDPWHEEQNFSLKSQSSISSMAHSLSQASPSYHQAFIFPPERPPIPMYSLRDPQLQQGLLPLPYSTPSLLSQVTQASYHALISQGNQPRMNIPSLWDPLYPQKAFPSPSPIHSLPRPSPQIYEPSHQTLTSLSKWPLMQTSYLRNPWQQQQSFPSPSSFSSQAPRVSAATGSYHQLSNSLLWRPPVSYQPPIFEASYLRDPHQQASPQPSCFSAQNLPHLQTTPSYHQTLSYQINQSFNAIRASNVLNQDSHLQPQQLACRSPFPTHAYLQHPQLPPSCIPIQTHANQQRPHHQTSKMNLGVTCKPAPVRGRLPYAPWARKGELSTRVENESAVTKSKVSNLETNFQENLGAIFRGFSIDINERGLPEPEVLNTNIIGEFSDASSALMSDFSYDNEAGKTALGLERMRPSESCFKKPKGRLQKLKSKDSEQQMEHTQAHLERWPKNELAFQQQMLTKKTLTSRVNHSTEMVDPKEVSASQRKSATWKTPIFQEERSPVVTAQQEATSENTSASQCQASMFAHQDRLLENTFVQLEKPDKRRAGLQQDESTEAVFSQQDRITKKAPSSGERRVSKKTSSFQGKSPKATSVSQLERSSTTISMSQLERSFENSSATLVTPENSVSLDQVQCDKTSLTGFKFPKIMPCEEAEHSAPLLQQVSISVAPLIQENEAALGEAPLKLDAVTGAHLGQTSQLEKQSCDENKPEDTSITGEALEVDLGDVFEEYLSATCGWGLGEGTSTFQPFSDDFLEDIGDIIAQSITESTGSQSYICLESNEPKSNEETGMLGANEATDNMTDCARVKSEELPSPIGNFMPYKLRSTSRTSLTMGKKRRRKVSYWSKGIVQQKQKVKTKLPHSEISDEVHDQQQDVKGSKQIEQQSSHAAIAMPQCLPANMLCEVELEENVFSGEVETLRKHLRDLSWLCESNPFPKSVMCPVCKDSLEAQDKYALLEHLAIHGQCLEPMPTCRICGMMCEDVESLLIHVCDEHTFEPRFCCTSCPSLHSNVDDIRYHHEILHPGNPVSFEITKWFTAISRKWPLLYMCQRCQSYKLHLTAMEKHTQEAHLNEPASGIIRINLLKPVPMSGLDLPLSLLGIGRMNRQAVSQATESAESSGNTPDLIKDIFLGDDVHEADGERNLEKQKAELTVSEAELKSFKTLLNPVVFIATLKSRKMVTNAQPLPSYLHDILEKLKSQLDLGNKSMDFLNSLPVILSGKPREAEDMETDEESNDEFKISGVFSESEDLDQQVPTFAYEGDDPLLLKVIHSIKASTDFVEQHSDAIYAWTTYMGEKFDRSRIVTVEQELTPQDLGYNAFMHEETQDDENEYLEKTQPLFQAVDSVNWAVQVIPRNFEDADSMPVMSDIYIDSCSILRNSHSGSPIRCIQAPHFEVPSSGGIPIEEHSTPKDINQRRLISELKEKNLPAHQLQPYLVNLFKCGVEPTCAFSTRIALEFLSHLNDIHDKDIDSVILCAYCRNLNNVEYIMGVNQCAIMNYLHSVVKLQTLVQWKQHVPREVATIALNHEVGVHGAGRVICGFCQEGLQKEHLISHVVDIHPNQALDLGHLELVESAPIPMVPELHNYSFGMDEIDEIPQISIMTKEVSCTMCGYATKVRHNLVSHLQQHKTQMDVSNKTPVNPIPICTQSMLIQCESSNFASGHFERGLADDNCEKCKDNIEEGQGNICSVNGCQYINPSESLYRKHTNTLDAAEDGFKCLHNKVVFSSMGKHYNHRRLHDPSSNPPEVINLQKPTASSEALENSGDKSLQPLWKWQDLSQVKCVRGIPVSEDFNTLWPCQYSCLMCSYKTEKEYFFRDHLRREVDYPRFSCTLCVFTCLSKVEIIKHFQSYHRGADFIITALPILPDKEKWIKDQIQAQGRYDGLARVKRPLDESLEDSFVKKNNYVADKGMDDDGPIPACGNGSFAGCRDNGRCKEADDETIDGEDDSDLFALAFIGWVEWNQYEDLCVKLELVVVLGVTLLGVSISQLYPPFFPCCEVRDPEEGPWSRLLALSGHTRDRDLRSKVTIYMPLFENLFLLNPPYDDQFDDDGPGLFDPFEGQSEDGSAVLVVSFDRQFGDGAGFASPLDGHCDFDGSTLFGPFDDD